MAMMQGRFGGIGPSRAAMFNARSQMQQNQGNQINQMRQMSQMMGQQAPMMSGPQANAINRFGPPNQGGMAQIQPVRQQTTPQIPPQNPNPSTNMMGQAGSAVNPTPVGMGPSPSFWGNMRQMISSPQAINAIQQYKQNQMNPGQIQPFQPQMGTNPYMGMTTDDYPTTLKQSQMRDQWNKDNPSGWGPQASPFASFGGGQVDMSKMIPPDQVDQSKMLVGGGQGAQVGQPMWGGIGMLQRQLQGPQRFLMGGRGGPQ